MQKFCIFSFWKYCVSNQGYLTHIFMLPNMAHFFIIAVLTSINQFSTLIGDSVICKTFKTSWSSRWHGCYSGLHKLYEDYVMQSFQKAVSVNVAIRRLLCDLAKHPAFIKGLPWLQGWIYVTVSYHCTLDVRLSILCID